MNVSRETSDLIERYRTLLLRWNRSINLVGRGAVEATLERHLADSLAVAMEGRDIEGPWLDMGSGGGFPGIVCAILRRGRPEPVTLVDSDARKGAFLRTVVRELGLRAAVATARIEEAPPAGAAVVSAKALAPLSMLFSYAVRHLAEGGVALFPKGPGYLDELAEARKGYRFDATVLGGSGGSVILRVEGLQRAA